MSITQNNSLSLALNGDSKTFRLGDSAENYDLFASEYIEINNDLSNNSTDNNEFIVFEKITINNNRIALYDGVAKDYETSLLLIDSIRQDCCSIASTAPAHSNDISLNKDLNNQNGFLNTIIISTTLLSFIVLTGIFLLVYFFMNSNFKKNLPNMTNIERIINEKNDFSKFNSRNKLEISLNSDQNSDNLDESPSSSLSRETPSAVLTNSSTREPRLHVKDERSFHNNNTTGNEQNVNAKRQPMTDQFDFNLLNWLPSYNEYQSVISEFEAFPSANMISSVIYHETDMSQINYTNYVENEIESYLDKQTFV